MLYMQLGANEFQGNRSYSGIDIAQMNSRQILNI
jgi:hypothetical protein